MLTHREIGCEETLELKGRESAGKTTGALREGERKHKKLWREWVKEKLQEHMERDDYE